LAIYPGPKTENPEPDLKAAQEAWQFVKETINSGVFEMVVLSEFVDLLEYNVVDEHEVVDSLSKRPEDLHVIITGANPPRSLVDAADLVTAINKVGRVG
jgi:ATP:corrinoid adenosyltransferase